MKPALVLVTGLLQALHVTAHAADALAFLKSFTATANSTQARTALCQTLFASAEFRYLY